MKDIYVAITAASYSGNKGAAAMLQSSISQLYEYYGDKLNINLMSVYPKEDKEQIPFDFIKVISCKPEQLLFVSFPLALLHYIFQWCKPLCMLLEKNKILKSYSETDFVIDEAGISFVDSRGFVMNTYAFVCAAVPILMRVPVVKYSQAMGPFHTVSNRLLAKMILPKLRLICARGQVTYDNLAEVGIMDNVVLCADGAFTMSDSILTKQEVGELCEKEKGFYNDNVIGISLSSVVEKKCKKNNIDYKKIMVEFIDYLNEEGFHVLLIANAARENSIKSRNNDLMVCDEIYADISDKDAVMWYHKEMTPEEIREHIGKCRVLVASRFHAMVGALQRKVPVLLVGWSHKYQEVLDMFGLGKYAIDFSTLSFEILKREFHLFMADEKAIREQIEVNYDKVIESSKNNIKAIVAAVNGLETSRKKTLFDFTNPEKYIGKHLVCRKGYAGSEEIRANAASGGIITALLCYLLETKQIDGAWVTRSSICNGELGYYSYIATTKDEIMAASSSVYMDMPLLRHIEMLRQFPGKLAVVLTPCMMQAFNVVLGKEKELNEKVVLKIGLFCSGNHSKEATLLPLKKLKITLEDAQRLYYRRGHWRGVSTVRYNDGTSKDFSYTKSICAYKNAYFFEKKRCMLCQNHFASTADISMGDIWLKSMRKEACKNTCCIIRTNEALSFYKQACSEGVIIDSHISRKDVIRGQKRALVFKFQCAKAKIEMLKKEGKIVSTDIDVSECCRWNHRLAFWLAEKNRKFSIESYEKLSKVPMVMIYYYMCLIRMLLSF